MSKARDLADGTFDTDTLVVDAANNRVGVGTASPTTKGHFYSSTSMDQLSVDGVGAIETGINFKSGGTTYGQIYFNNVSPYDMSVLQQYSTGSLIFGTNDTEAMRIDSSQRLLVGKTSGGSISTFGNELGSAGYAMHSRSGGTPLFIGRAVSTGSFCDFYYGASTPSGFVGSISTNGSSTSYNTTSDYRLKENVVDLTGASDRVNQIPVHRFNFISDPDTTVDGFLAHEVQAVVPEAVTGTQDGMRDEEYEVTPAVLDDDGNVVTEAVMGTRSVPDYQGIDQSKLVPLITAALREALAKIETLETEMTSVKARLDALETP